MPSSLFFSQFEVVFRFGFDVRSHHRRIVHLVPAFARHEGRPLAQSQGQLPMCLVDGDDSVGGRLGSIGSDRGRQQRKQALRQQKRVG